MRPLVTLPRVFLPVLIALPIAILGLAAMAARAEEKSSPQAFVEGCACKKLEVTCSDEKKKAVCGEMAGACASGCEMYFTEKLCRQTGLESGTMPTDQMVTKLRSCQERIAKNIDLPTDPKEAVLMVSDCASGIHELFHTCIPQLGAGNRQTACEEWGGKSTEFLVYKAAFGTFCEPEEKRMVDGKLSPVCQLLCGHAYNQDRIGGWLKCLCDATDSSQGFLALDDWLTKDECCTCYDRCVRDRLDIGQNWLPPYCNTYYASPDIQRSLNAEAESACRSVAFDPNHYSCGKMSRDGQSQFGKSCR